MKRTICALSVSLVLGLTVLSPGSAFAEKKETSAWGEAGLGVGAVVSTLLWGGTKTICALGGTLTAGLAYVLTGFDSVPARAVLQATLRGDYVVTPDHLTGKKPLSFVGRDPRYDPYPYDE